MAARPPPLPPLPTPHPHPFPLAATGRATTASLQARMEERIYDGCALTLAVVVHSLLTTAQRFRLEKEALNAICRLIRLLLPSGALFPPSAHVLYGLGGVEEVERYERHGCACGYVWPHCPKPDWPVHYADVCPEQGCGQPRFKTLKGGRRMPARVRCHCGMMRVSTCTRTHTQ